MLESLRNKRILVIVAHPDERNVAKWQSELDLYRSSIRSAQKTIGYESFGIYDFPDNRFDTLPLLDLIKANFEVLKLCPVIPRVKPWRMKL